MYIVIITLIIANITEDPVGTRYCVNHFLKLHLILSIVYMRSDNFPKVTEIKP